MNESQNSGIPKSQAARVSVIHAARKWADELIDRSGRNEMLFCKDRSKLLLDDADPDALSRLLLGHRVWLRDLFPDSNAYKAAAKVTEGIRRRIKQYDEERGVRVGRVVHFFASWRDAKERDVRAPVLLRELVIQRSPGFDDLTLQADPDLEVNPVLLSYVDSTFGVRLDPDLISELNDVVDDPARVQEGVDRLAIELRSVPDFRITPGYLAGTFHYAKLAMHKDLLENAELFAENDLFAAVAGDSAAIAAIRQHNGTIVDRRQPDRTAPADEFLVLDADPSQNYAINAALAGRNLVIQGPPGTGKSQTICNLISSLTARGKSVLFVAEKRAAIDAVLKRLNNAGLGGLVLDLHVSTANRTVIYQQFREAIASARRAHPVDADAEHRALERARDVLVRHAEAMHKPIEPWQISMFDAQAALIGTPEPARTHVRFPTGVVNGLTGETRERVREALARLVDIGGLLPRESRVPWASATTMLTNDEAIRALDAARMLGPAIRDLRNSLDDLASRTGLPMPQNLIGVQALLDLCERTSAVACAWRPELFEHDLALLVAATGSAAYRAQAAVSLGLWQRFTLARTARRLRVGKSRTLHTDLMEVVALSAQWHRLASIRWPEPVPEATATHAAFNVVYPLITELAAVLSRRDLLEMTWAQLTELQRLLVSDPLAASLAAEANRLLASLRTAGLGELLAWLETVVDGWGHEARDLALTALDFAWYGSIVDTARAADPHLATFDGRSHSRVAREFIDADTRHLDVTRARIRRLAAERLTAVRSEHPDQDQFLDTELGKKRRLLPLRELLGRAPDVLVAARPCWAMSPLMVSQVLPPNMRFDVVIFDEASQVQPAEAMPALARGNTAVIAGDSRQLPPTTFFEEAVESEADGDDEDPPGLLSEDVDSILDAFNRALGESLAHEYYLGWHYRSEDARLIALSNAMFYDNRMITFPGSAVEPPLRLITVSGEAELASGSRGRDTGTSDRVMAPEVERVVDLMVQHARQRPTESLGVIALSMKQADRIEAALQKRLRDEPDIRDFFDESVAEPYFVKNLERVQGDERDAIILSVGFGKVNGRLPHRFGPLNRQGGERRLNVAITRAKKRMTVVASFSPDDLDPARTKAEGVTALAEFLRYAARGGNTLESLRRKVSLNPFESSVRDRLHAAGLKVVCQHGEAGYFIDFAVLHPEQDGRFVLAIEADGASYHSGETARARDRLRQEHLERLGWRFHRIWSTDWFRDPDTEMAKIMAAYEAAVRGSAEMTREAAQAVPKAEDEARTTPREVEGRDRPLRSKPMPVVAGLPIRQYADYELRRLIAWIKSDGLLRTHEELLREAAKALGFSRVGSQIRSRLMDAIQAEDRLRRPTRPTTRHRRSSETDPNS